MVRHWIIQAICNRISGRSLPLDLDDHKRLQRSRVRSRVVQIRRPRSREHKGRRVVGLQASYVVLAFAMLLLPPAQQGRAQGARSPAVTHAWVTRDETLQPADPSTRPSFGHDAAWGALRATAESGVTWRGFATLAAGTSVALLAVLLTLWLYARATGLARRRSDVVQRALFEQAPIACLEVSWDGDIVRANRAASELFGYDSADQLVSARTRIGPQLFADANDWHDVLASLTVRDETAPRGYALRRRDGALFRGSVSAAKTMDGRGGGYIFVAEGPGVASPGDLRRTSVETATLGSRFTAGPGSMELSDIIDMAPIQSLMESFHEVTRIPIAILDVSGRVLVSTGWQDICTRFHRAHPETCRNCLESDTVLSQGVTPGTYEIHRCKNNMWDVVTPITVAGEHVGNVFVGQFFFEGEAPDREVFRRQAQQFGFDENEYLAALDRVPHLGRETIDAVMTFFTRLTGVISDLSHRNVELARLLSERDRLLRSLRESEEKYRALVENAGEVIYVAQDGVIRFANAAAAEFIGYTQAELTSRSFANFAHPDDRAAVVARHYQRMKGIAVDVPSEFRVIRRTGEVRWVNLNAVLIDWEGRVATLNFVNDITDRKHAEEDRARMEAELRQVQKMDAVGRLAGGVAHDFNNMLTVILGYVNVAMASLDSGDPLRVELTEIEQAARRSADLTRQLLAFSRKQMVVPKVIDLNEIIDCQKSLLARLIGEDIRIDWAPAEDLWRVRIDPAQVDQILTNLAVNARDAIGGVGLITIATSNVPDGTHPLQPGDYVRLSFHDTGSGMDAEVLEHIFEPFFTTKSVGEGTGLGLSTVYGIVEQNNGVILVDSTPGHGTTFDIYFPRFDGALGNADDEATAHAAEGTETVLVVEDETQILYLIRRVLERDGYSVLTADTPAEACALAEQHAGRIDLLVTDVVMPTMNGKDLQTRIRETNPSIQTLFMSGYTADVIAHRGVVDEGVEFIQKPFALDVLSAKVRALLDARPVASGAGKMFGEEER